MTQSKTTRIMPEAEKFCMFIGLDTIDGDMYHAMMDSIKELFNDFKKTVLVISGPGCSGKSVFLNIIKEIADLKTPGLNNDFIIFCSNPGEHPKRWCNQDPIVFFSMKRTISSASQNPFLLGEIRKEIPEIIKWLQSGINQETVK